MSDKTQSTEHLEGQLRAAAATLSYPPTPDIAGAVRRRLAAQHRTRQRSLRLALGLLAALLALLAVPQVRAAVARAIQIGTIRIIFEEPTPLPASATPAAAPAPTTTPSLPISTATPIASLLDLAGETSLEEARQRVSYPIKLPAYPEELGPPDRVFVQRVDGQMVVLVWLDPEKPGGISMSLSIIQSDMPLEKSFAVKTGVTILQEANVGSRRAIWVQGPHFLQIRQGNSTDYTLRYLVKGNVLIWTDGELTYRLESGLTLAEAIKVAESLPVVSSQ
jgi:hypothetical protein